MDDKPLTHADLVARAERWLRNTVGCSTVITAANIVNDELPDAIGFKCSGYSCLVECKISRADFFRDPKKLSRTFPEYGMGTQRFYLTPPGLLTLDDIPDNWGLLEWGLHRINRRLDAEWLSEKNRAEETVLLLAHIRRLERSPPNG